MNRRDTIKSLLLGSVAAGLTLKGCAPATSNKEAGTIALPDYGRTEEEKKHDQKIMSQTLLNAHELSTIAVLCDLILPENENFGSATDAGVHDFIEFIIKDLPSHQTPIRGGLMWLDNYSQKTTAKNFISCTEQEQKTICDQIAYPNKTEADVKQGEQFFTRMRNLTLTGYYTSKMGLEDLGYQGNVANVWDGVPEEVLKAHNMAYDEVWLSKCVDQSKRAEIAVWDDQGNLIS